MSAGLLVVSTAQLVQLVSPAIAALLRNVNIHPSPQFHPWRDLCYKRQVLTTGAAQQQPTTTVETMATATTAAADVLTVATWRGIDLGWVAVGQPRTAAAAARLLRLVERVRPDYRNSLRPA